ncbi:MAG TPA: type I-F CRISPR-associated protein Csy1 [Marinobacter sp.]|uniref:type I-F CRISPR-associated protein Csy1 n=1 Tax=Marinobacter sp. TaxID=50741 RepID=UPI002D7E89C0|nr:type I-F CRISPR-associated protein Csy1 [Marinobacter sp.]HET8802566.1 type I-F CRISPR-associated protein Csy1 [Marinobacter sp.]
MDVHDESLASNIRAFIAERLAAKLELFDKAAEKKRNETPAEQLAKAETLIQSERLELIEQYKPENWLADASRRAGQISMVTHAPKFTHSDTRSTGVLLRTEDKQRYVQSERYVDSLTLNDLPVDVVGNAAALDVARLLQLEGGGSTLLDEVAAGDSPALKELATSSEQAQEWLQGFQGALQDKALTSGQLSKQLYFPAAESYHLISPLYASSLSHNLHERLTDSFYSEHTKTLRQARKGEKYHPDDLVIFPNIAVQSFGGTKPQNISQLNTKRYGRAYLLSSQPPHWEQKASLPVKGQQAFWNEYNQRAWKTAKVLRRYLEGIFKRTSTLKRRDRRAELVDELVDTLLLCAANIQHQSDKGGWSTESDLTLAEQLWLDPHRSEFDEAFKAEREKNEWQGEIARQFAAWLNHKLSYKSDLLYTGDPEFGEWQKLLERKLLLLKDDLEVAA